MMRRLAPAALLIIVFTVQAVPPNPQSWDLENSVHHATGEELPWPALEALAAERSEAQPMPTPPLMGAVAVLVEFPDHLADTGAHPRTAYEELLFSQGTYATGSLRDYWNTVSYGAFDLAGGVAGWFMTAEKYADYYNDGNYGLSYGGYRVAQAAAELADATVDFGEYDNDGPDGIPNSGDDDGIVDLFMVYHAGPDGADTGDPKDIWSHMSYLGYTTDDPAAGGGMIFIEDYDIQAEERADGSLSGISVACHEMGHLLNLPDQYGPHRYDLGTGLWSLMSYGAWGADGLDDRYPSFLDAWSRSELGWTNVINLAADENDLLVPPAETDNTVYTLWDGGAPDYDEWFYLENRQQLDPEPTLVGEGLLVYHIYSGAHGFGFRYYDLDVEQADGLEDLDNGDGERPDPEEDNIGDAGDPFPGSTGNTRFADDTTPSSRDRSGYSTWVEISDIRLSGDDVLCDITIDTSATGELELFADSRREGLLLRWVATPDCRSYHLSRWTDAAWTTLGSDLSTSAYLDRGAAGEERYRLEAFDAAGRPLTSVEAVFSHQAPSTDATGLAVYPNPLRGPLNVEFELAAAGEIELALYDLAGRRLATLAAGHYAAGRHTLGCDPGLSAGLYLLRLRTADQTLQRRLVVGD